MFRGPSAVFTLFIPNSIIEGKIKKWLLHAGSRDEARHWLGIRLLIAFLIGAIFFLIPFTVFPLLNVFFNANIYFAYPINVIVMLGFGIAGVIATLMVFYLHLTYVIDGRKKMVENILPDFLFLVGNNLKSGMAPFYAFRSAIRPEFGPLSEEIKIATQKSLGVESFSEALKGIGERIDSKVLSDTTKFFAQAMRSGGHLAQLIETTAADIKQTNRLKKELVTSTRMYTLFILFVVVAASPILLAVSVNFLQILGGIQLQTATTTSTPQAGITAARIAITPEFMKNIGYFLIVVNSILAGIFMGVIGGGKIRDGVRYAPIMIIIGLIIFTAATSAIGGLVGGLS